MNERQLVTRIMQIVNSSSQGFAVKTAPIAGGNKGLPDIIGSYKGRPFAVECKIGNNKADGLQKYWLLRMQKGGYVTGVVRSLEEFEGLFV